eukprot:1195809-Prorocentrum_minimum.AAC.11
MSPISLSKEPGRVAAGGTVASAQGLVASLQAACCRVRMRRDNSRSRVRHISTLPVRQSFSHPGDHLPIPRELPLCAYMA